MYHYCLSRLWILSKKIKVIEAKIAIKNIFDDVAFISVVIALEILWRDDIQKIKKGVSVIDKSRLSGLRETINNATLAKD